MDYTENERPACPICDELAGGCGHPEAEAAYRQWKRAQDDVLTGSCDVCELPASECLGHDEYECPTCGQTCDACETRCCGAKGAN